MAAVDGVGRECVMERWADRTRLDRTPIQYKIESEFTTSIVFFLFVFIRVFHLFIYISTSQGMGSIAYLIEQEGEFIYCSGRVEEKKIKSEESLF